MAVTEIPARDFTFELNTGTSGSPTWVEVLGLTTWSHSPQSTDADTQTWDDGGRMSHQTLSRGDQFTLTGRYQEDPSDGSRDPGQEAVESWSAGVGTASLKQFRITSSGGTIKTFEATATVTSGGGGENDVNTWQAAIKVSGAITTS